MRTRVRAIQRFKQMPCRDCGKQMDVGSNTRNQPRCIDCGVEAATLAIRQMKDGSGMYYDRWLAGCLASSRRNP